LSTLRDASSDEIATVCALGRKKETDKIFRRVLEKLTAALGAS
jgi:hypothetical protein